MAVCDHEIKYCNVSTKKGVSMKTKIRNVLRKPQNLWRGKSLKIRKEKLLLQNIKKSSGIPYCLLCKRLHSLSTLWKLELNTVYTRKMAVVSSQWTRMHLK